LGFFAVLDFCEAKRRERNPLYFFYIFLAASVLPNPTLAATRSSRKEYHLTDFT
jgi:hypothetical protein